VKHLHRLTAAAALTVAFFPALTPARQPARQSDRNAVEHCGGPVFRTGEVTRKARVTHKPAPGLTDEARANDVRGTVQLTAVLCRTGRVTDIQVLQGLPHGMTEKAVEAARGIRFRPATKGGRRVSQTITLQYDINVLGSHRGPGGWAGQAGRLVEEVLIEGNRRLTDEQIFSHLRTRPGERFVETTVRRDLQTLLDLGKFDTTQTRVSTEQGAQGGVVVIFSVVELPVIRSLAFKGLRSVGEADILRALRERQTGVGRESVYDPAKVAAARRVILELLAARGRPGAAVEAEVTELSAVSVELTFVVNEGPPARDARPGRWF
jgi:TonB family protein